MEGGGRSHGMMRVVRGSTGMGEGLILAAWMLLLLAGGSQAARWGASSTKEVGKGAGDVVHDLITAKFNTTLAAAPATWALVEFYAHWCGACQRYKPHYEKIAHLFNGPDSVHAGVVYMARVDCADQEKFVPGNIARQGQLKLFHSFSRKSEQFSKANQELCTRFAISYYPTLLWAAPPILAFGDRLAKGGEGVEEVKDSHTAEKLLAWINKKVSKEYSLKDATIEEVTPSGKQSSEILKVAASLHDIEEATAMAFQIMLNEKLLNARNRGPFIQFVQLLVSRHPSKRCRKGSADLLVNLAELWPDGGSPTEAFSKHHLCGDSLTRNFWVSCRGENRGYSCGLWLLFHSLSVRVSDHESSAAFLAIHTFVEHFFNCEECRRHYLIMSSSALNTISTQRDLVLWLWRAHNEVNKRLAKEEAAPGKRSVKHPRTVWPTKELCTDCLKTPIDINKTTGKDEPDWDNDAVYKWLMDWYGPSLQTLPKMKWKGRDDVELSLGGDESGSSESSVVRNGAAVGVLIASCGFGLITCWWRMQQKKRKY